MIRGYWTNVLESARSALLFYGNYFVVRLSCSLSGLLLKRGIECGLTPYELSRLYIREELKQETPSVIEKIIQQCVMKMKSLSPRNRQRKEERRDLVRSNTVTEFPSSPRALTECSSFPSESITNPPSCIPFTEPSEFHTEPLSSSVSLTRILSTHSFSSLTYTDEPYRFPPVR